MSQYQQSRPLLGQPAVSYHSPVKFDATVAAVPFEHVAADAEAGAISGSHSPLVRPMVRSRSPHSPSSSSQPSGNNSPKPLCISSAHRYGDPQPLLLGDIAAHQQLIGQHQQQAAQQMAAAPQLGSLPQLPSLPFVTTSYLSDLSATAASSPKLSNNDGLPVAGGLSASFPDALDSYILASGQSSMGLPSVGAPPPQTANPYSNFFPSPLLSGRSPSTTTAPASPSHHNAQSSMFGFGRGSAGPISGTGPSPSSSAASGGGGNPFASVMLPLQQLMTARGQNALQQMSAMNNLGLSAALQQQMATTPLMFPNPITPALPGSPSTGHNSFFNQQPNGNSGTDAAATTAILGGSGGVAPANLFAGMSGFDFPGLKANSFVDPVSRISSSSLDGTTTPPTATAINPLASSIPFIPGWAGPMDPMATMSATQSVLQEAAAARYQPSSDQTAEEKTHVDEYGERPTQYGLPSFSRWDITATTTSRSPIQADEVTNRILEAIRWGDSDSVLRYIEDGGATEVTVDGEPTSVLLLMMRRSDYTIDEDVAMEIIDRGAALTGTVTIGDDDWNHYEEASVLHCAYVNSTRAAGSPTFIALLAHEECDVNARCTEPATDDDESPHFTQVIRNGMRRYTEGYALEKATVLHVAVAHRDVDAVRLLCESERADVNLACSLVLNKHIMHMDTLLHRNELPSHLPENEFAGDLGEYWTCRDGVHAYRWTGVSALHLAARSACPRTVEILLRVGADPYAIDSVGKTPLDYLRDTISQHALFDPLDDQDPTFVSSITDDELTSCQSLLNAAAKRLRHIRRMRLTVGDGNFTFTQSLLTKLGKSPVVATELISRERLIELHGEPLRQRLEHFSRIGVRCYFEVDARKLHVHDELSTLWFHKIHFNFPRDKGSLRNPTLPAMLREFFVSAASLQRVGDYIYIALPQPVDEDKRRHYEAYVYRIFDASVDASYVYTRKRHFGSERYPGYVHAKTDKRASARIADEAREFIFTKTHLKPAQIRGDARYGPGGWHTSATYHGTYPYLTARNTDDDDSTSYESSSDERAAKRSK